MSAGTLSSDQQRFADQLGSLTHIDPTVITAWIGAESGWDVTKASHNYLNIGPGRAYPSVDAAAGSTAAMINGSKLYTGIRSAVPAGPIATVKAIEASPWDSTHYSGGRLANIYTQLANVPGPGDPIVATPVGLSIPNPITAIGGLAGRIGSLFGIDKWAVSALQIGLQIVMTVAGLGLIALGLSRLTSRDPKGLVEQLQKGVGNVGQAAALAAVV